MVIVVVTRYTILLNQYLAATSAQLANCKRLTVQYIYTMQCSSIQLLSLKNRCYRTLTYVRIMSAIQNISFESFCRQYMKYVNLANCQYQKDWERGCLLTMFVVTLYISIFQLLLADTSSFLNIPGSCHIVSFYSVKVSVDEIFGLRKNIYYKCKHKSFYLVRRFTEKARVAHLETNARAIFLIIWRTRERSFVISLLWAWHFIQMNIVQAHTSTTSYYRSRVQQNEDKNRSRCTKGWSKKTMLFQILICNFLVNGLSACSLSVNSH